MKRHNKFGTFFCLVVTLCLLLLNFPQAQAQTYEVIIYNPLAGFIETEVEGIGGVQRVGAGRVIGGTSLEYSHALLWTGNSTTPVDLNPVGTAEFNYSRLYDTDGMRQVGYVENRMKVDGHRYAAVWSGTANSFVRLVTDNNTYSEAFAIAGNQQVGYIYFPSGCGECGPLTETSAVLWHGTPESRVYLHPNGINCFRSYALDTDGMRQVGYGLFSSGAPIRALLWSGTRESAVVLHLPGYLWTFARAVKDDIQVGYGHLNNNGLPGERRALLWRGTPSDVRILGNGIINDTNGTSHVGAIPFFSTYFKAFRWDGDTGAGVDLHQFLPKSANYISSEATGIDETGNIVGYALTESGHRVGVLWRSSNVNNMSPSVYLLQPRRTGFYNARSRISFTASAHDPDGNVVSVEFYANGEMVGAASAPAKNDIFEISWMPPRAGRFRIQAKAIDNNGASNMSRPEIIQVRY